MLMAASGRRPPEEQTVRHWKTLKVNKNSQVTAFIAGPCVGVDVHNAKKTMPCLKKYLGGTHACAGCGAGLRHDWVCYQPVYLAITDGAHVGLFHKDMFPRLDKVQKHARVLIGRPEGDNPGLWVREEKGGSYSGDNPAHQAAADICDWLPVLWKLRGVMTAELVRGGPVAASPPPAPPADTLPPVDPDLAAMMRQRGIPLRSSPSEAVGMGDVIDGVLRPTVLNGKHKPKPR
jgi:hypothetical protein